MVNIVIQSIVVCEHLQWIPWQEESGMIIDCFQCREGKEKDSLADS